MIALTTLLGALLLLLLFYDVYATVIVPRGPAGPIARRLYAGSWRAWHAWVGHDTLGARRRLSRLGPLLIPLTVLMWGVMLLLAFTLISLSSAHDFLVDGRLVFPAWFKALYVSGYSITTLGVGDITPSGMPLRLVMILAGATGFVLITVAVTYLLSVYATFDRLTSLAFEIHRFVGRAEGCTPADMIAMAYQADGVGELGNWLASTASTLAEVVQAEEEFPLLHYFHTTNERALPLAMTDLMEIVTVCRTVLDPTHFASLSRGIVTRGTERIVRGYFVSLNAKFPEPQLNEADVTRGRAEAFEQAWNALSAVGAPVRPRVEAWAGYEKMRRVWDRESVALRLQLGYPVLDAWMVPPQDRDSATVDW